MRFYLKRISEARRSLWSFLILFIGLSLFTNCCKDKVKVPEPIEPTKWEKIAGDYKVYDTNNVFLYEMSISHIHNNSNNTDSLCFTNYGDLFYFTAYQSPWSGIPEGYISIGSINPIVDKYGKRWHLSQATNTNYNVMNNDTIVLRYRRVNILYYLADLVPYCDTTIVEIAVKQY